MNYVKIHSYPQLEYRIVGKKKPRKLPIDFTVPRFPLLVHKWGRIMFEEAQQLRNFKTPTLRACHTLDGLFRVLLPSTSLTNEYGDIHSIFRVLRVPPFDDLEWFKSHFLRRPTKNSNEMAYSQRVRESEIPPLEVTRNAFLFLAIRAESIRRTRGGTFSGILLSQGLPKVHDIDIALDLDDGQKYDQIFQYAMQDVPPGFNNDTKQMHSCVDEVFPFVYDPHPPQPFEGKTFMKHPENFYPRNERDTQLITKNQWSNKLRDAIKNDLEAEYITEDDNCRAEPDHEELLANMSMAKLAAAYWAVPGAKYGVNVPIELDVEDGDFNERGGTLNRKCQEARTVFKRWLRAAHGN